MKYFLVSMFLIFISSNSIFSQTMTTVSKNCGKCGGVVSSFAGIGERCPHCGVIWGNERTTRTTSTQPRSNRTKKYSVISNRAYFYRTPDFSSRRNAYLVYGEEVRPLKIYNGFIYVVFYNDEGKKTYGWLSKYDLE